MISTIAEKESFNDGCILNVRSMKKYTKWETAEKQGNNKQKKIKPTENFTEIFVFRTLLLSVRKV